MPMQAEPGGGETCGCACQAGPWPKFSEDELRRFTAAAGNSPLGQCVRRAADGEGEDPMAVHDSYL